MSRIPFCVQLSVTVRCVRATDVPSLTDKGRRIGRNRYQQISDQVVDSTDHAEVPDGSPYLDRASNR